MEESITFCRISVLGYEIKNLFCSVKCVFFGFLVIFTAFFLSFQLYIEVLKSNFHNLPEPWYLYTVYYYKILCAVTTAITDDSNLQ